MLNNLPEFLGRAGYGKSLKIKEFIVLNTRYVAQLDDFFTNKDLDHVYVYGCSDGHVHYFTVGNRAKYRMTITSFKAVYKLNVKEFA